jgi:CRP-like cAMP-binding protein
MGIESSNSTNAVGRTNVIWPPAALRILRRTLLEDFAAERIAAHKGRHLVVEGAKSSSVFFQLTGWSAAECVSQRGDRILMDFLTAGDFIGLADEGPYAAYTVTALTDLAVLRIERSQIHSLVEHNKAFREVYIEALQAMLARAHLRRQALSAKSGVAKVCQVLSDLSDRVESAGDNATGVSRSRLPISQVLLACAVGLTPVAVNRIVQNLRQAGIVDWGVSGLSVLDLARLREFA